MATWFYDSTAKALTAAFNTGKLEFNGNIVRFRLNNTGANPVYVSLSPNDTGQFLKVGAGGDSGWVPLEKISVTSLYIKGTVGQTYEFSTVPG